MPSFLSIFGIVPGWLWAALLGAAMLNNCHTSAQRDEARVKLAEERQKRSDDDAKRERLAREDAMQVAKDQFKHAERQQEKTHAYTTEIARLKDARATDAVATRSLLDTIATYTTSGRREGESDTIACSRDRDRLKVVGQLLGEGVELAAEGQAVVRRRDAEVSYLLDVIANDRALCGSAK